MGIFGSASNKQVDEFARELAKQIFELRTTASRSGGSNLKAAQKNVDQQFDALWEKTAAFHKQHKLGLYKKARLANTFRWELKERGYDEALVETLTERVVMAVSRKA
jgi:hypothetical protein